MAYINPRTWTASLVTVPQLQEVSDSMVEVAKMAGALGRLTLETGVPVSATDQTAKTTLYYTPYLGNEITLYDSTNSRSFPLHFAETSISLAGLTASRPYDCFGFNNSGTFALELLAWTNATTRATALALADGYWVKSGTTTRRYLGTICINASGGQCEDTAAARFVWNMYNRVPRPLRRIESTNSWTYTTDTYRQMNAAAANKVEIVVGLQDALMELSLLAHSDNSSAEVNRYSAIGQDSTSAAMANQLIEQIRPNSIRVAGQWAQITHLPAIGYHYYAALERSQATGTTTWYGDGGSGATDVLQSGLLGFIVG